MDQRASSGSPGIQTTLLKNIQKSWLAYWLIMPAIKA